MLVLFDNGTPRTLARYLIDRHAVTEARVVVLGQGRWSLIKAHVAEVVAAVGAATAGRYVEIDIPAA